MATITRHIVVCDVCRDIERPVTVFRAAWASGRLRTYALCEEDGAPVRDLLSRMGAGEVPGAPARRRRSVSMEQIEQVKAAREIPLLGFTQAL